MLELIIQRSKDFESLIEKYQDLRTILEKALVNNKPFVANNTFLEVKMEREFKKIPLEVILRTNWYESFNGLSTEEKLQKLEDFTIFVSVTDKKSGTHLEEKVHATSTLIPEGGRVESDSTTYLRASTVVKNFESLADLLKTPQEK